MAVKTLGCGKGFKVNKESGVSDGVVATRIVPVERMGGRGSWGAARWAVAMTRHKESLGSLLLLLLEPLQLLLACEGLFTGRSGLCLVGSLAPQLGSGGEWASITGKDCDFLGADSRGVVVAEQTEALVAVVAIGCGRAVTDVGQVDRAGRAIRVGVGGLGWFEWRRVSRGGTRALLLSR